MENRYKLILFNKKIYREIELPVDGDRFSVGTAKKCEAKIAKELFFEEIGIFLEKEGGIWYLSCSDNLYFLSEGVIKLDSVRPNHGDRFEVKYHSSNQSAFKLDFMLDFDFENKEYNWKIDVGRVNRLLIGSGSNCGIMLRNDLIGQGQILFARQKEQWFIHDKGGKYGVYVNGIRKKSRVPIGDYDFFSFMGFSFYYKENCLYTAWQPENMTVANLPTVKPEQKNHMEYPKFNRNTRIQHRLCTDPIEILSPPDFPKEPKDNLFISVFPAIGMLAATVLLRKTTGGGGSFLLFSLCSMGFGIVASAANFWKGKREYRKQIKERKERYLCYLKEKQDEITKSREKEKAVLEKIYYSTEESCRLAEDFSEKLFERGREDKDFLHLYLGKGDKDARREICYKKQQKLEMGDELQGLLEKLAHDNRLLKDVPITIDLKAVNAVGIVGERDWLFIFLNNLLLDVSIRHDKQDIRLVFVVSEKDGKEAWWARMLPALQNERIGRRNLVCDEESRAVIFEYLYRELSARENGDGDGSHWVVFVADSEGLSGHPISKYIGAAAELKFTFLFFQQYEELLPKGCDKIVRLSGNQGVIVDASGRDREISFRYLDIGQPRALAVASKIASIYCEEVNLENALAKSISLYDLLNIAAAEELDLAEQWDNSQIYHSMAAPLGVKAGGKPVELDLNEKRHGPHGLVAGTTGSGKSEILQSYILSMAVRYHPHELGFVIIDFKGGGMASQFRDLPHLIGTITNMDGKEINRSLLSIQAELLKRQALFADAGVAHIDDYMKKYKKGECEAALPHLVLIVDEFAELKSAQPEFMKELISAARIGRSLGVHLILATQKPSGVVDEQIWSNSKFRICLRVQNKEDSKEVIRSPLAAEITEPGRAYLQAGGSEGLTLFQSAYAKETLPDGDRIKRSEYKIYELSLSGRRKLVFHNKLHPGRMGEATQMEALIRHINKTCKDNRIRRLPDICLPPLPNSLFYENRAKKEKKKRFSIEVPLGIYDDPSHQLQEEAVLDLTSGHSLAIGSAQYGKTNILQLIIRYVAEEYSPDEVNFYLLDFASLLLKIFDGLNHVGGVVTAGDDEKVKHFMKLMLAEIDKRKEALSELGIGSFKAYRESGHGGMPQIVVLIDGFSFFCELFGEYGEKLLHIYREGISVGICLVITTSQMAGVSYRYMANISNRIALFCNDSGEYGSLYGYSRMVLPSIPGRGLIEKDKVIYEYQNYLSFGTAGETGQTDRIKSWIRQQNEKYAGMEAKKIPEIPKAVTLSYITDHYPGLIKSAYQFIIGLCYEDVSVCQIALDKAGMVGVMPGTAGGSERFIELLMEHFYRNLFDGSSGIFLLDDGERALVQYQKYGFVRGYSTDAYDMLSLFGKMQDIAQDRMDLVARGGKDALKKAECIVLIIHNQQAAQILSQDYELMEQYRQFAKQAKQLKMCLVYSNLENAPVTYHSPEPDRILKEEGCIFLLEDLDAQKLYDIPLSVSQKYQRGLGRGDAYMVEGNRFEKIKMVREGG